MSYNTKETKETKETMGGLKWSRKRRHMKKHVLRQKGDVSYMNEQNGGKEKDGFMIKLATFIVDKRNLFFLITIIGIIFSAFSRNWVEVENNLANYLPAGSETRLGLDVMEEEFTTYGTAQIMAANVTLDEAWILNDEIRDLEGVQSVVFDDSSEHYNNVSALYTVTFDYDETDDKCLKSLESIETLLKDYDLYISTALGDTVSENIDAEVSVIMVYVAVILVIVLFLTSQTYAEISVLLITFLTAMILNMGSNFLLGTNFVCIQFGRQYSAACALTGLRGNPLQPVQGRA